MADFPYDEHTQELAQTLLKLFSDCRPDMHEPDEQGWKDVTLRAGRFDNDGSGGEALLVFWHEDGSFSIDINICDLVALARLGSEYALGQLKEPQELWVFWEYDLPPFALGGKATKLAEDGTARAYVPSYQGFINYKWILVGEQGRKLKAALEEERERARRRSMEAQVQNKEAAAEILRNYGCTPPKRLEGYE